MRRIFLFFVFLLFAFTMQAAGHIRFMGIEVDGNYDSFKDSLETRGFKYMSSFETLYKYYGKFANEIVTLDVLASPKTHTVCKVIVYFPQSEDRESIKIAQKELEQNAIDDI